MANKKSLRNQGLHLDGPGSECMLDERKAKWQTSVVRPWSKALVILAHSPHPIFPIKYFSRLAQHWQNSYNFTYSIGCFLCFYPVSPTA